MNCRTAVELMPEWAAGRLNAPDADALRGHLRTCLACGEEARSYTALLETLGGAESVPSSRMRERLRRTIGLEKKKTRRSRIVRSLFAAAAVVAFALVLVQTFPPRKTEPLSEAGMATDRLREIAARRTATQGEDDLMRVLQTDPNPAIRLAALDSLVQSSSPDELRPALRRARLEERSPLVRDAMATVLDEVER